MFEVNPLDYDAKDTGEGALLEPGVEAAMKAKQDRQKRLEEDERDFEETFRLSMQLGMCLGHHKLKNGTWSKSKYNRYGERKVRVGRKQWVWVTQSTGRAKGETRKVANGSRQGRKRVGDPKDAKEGLSLLLSRAIKKATASGV